MFTATLRCGTVLYYEAPTFRPDPGDLVPCRRHGYCAVRSTSGSGSGGAVAPRGRRRTQSELLDWLRGRSETTVHTLRQHGFTLRMLAAAERKGLIDLDLTAGRVAVRPESGAVRAAVDADFRSLPPRQPRDALCARTDTTATPGSARDCGRPGGTAPDRQVE
jgi:hypothetical protein